MKSHFSCGGVYAHAFCKKLRKTLCKYLCKAYPQAEICSNDKGLRGSFAAKGEEKRVSGEKKRVSGEKKRVSGEKKRVSGEKKRTFSTSHFD